MAEVGLVLVGLPRLKTHLENLRNDHEQLLSRVGTFLKVERMKGADAMKIIQSVWQSASEEVISALTMSANGSVRTLVKLIGRVHRIMAVNRRPTKRSVTPGIWSKARNRVRVPRVLITITPTRRFVYDKKGVHSMKTITKWT
jgi:hypothetical protein